MGKILLMTRPEDDPGTRYLSKWSEKIIDEANNKGVRVIDLYREKANRKRFLGTLMKSNPSLLVLNGHGNENTVTGHNMQAILTEIDGSIVSGKIIFARACRSAKILGPNLVARGVVVYLGYREDFWFKHNNRDISRPLKDRTAALFLEPSNHLAISLLKGHSAGEANKKSQELYKKSIERLLVEGPLSEDYDNIRILFWNMINQVCVGNENTAF